MLALEFNYNSKFSKKNVRHTNDLADFGKQCVQVRRHDDWMINHDHNCGVIKLPQGFKLTTSPDMNHIFRVSSSVQLFTDQGCHSRPLRDYWICRLEREGQNASSCGRLARITGVIFRKIGIQ